MHPLFPRGVTPEARVSTRTFVCLCVCVCARVRIPLHFITVSVFVCIWASYSILSVCECFSTADEKRRDRGWRQQVNLISSAAEEERYRSGHFKFIME